MKQTIHAFLRTLSPVQTLTLGYASYILVVFAMLALPGTGQAEGISALDHLFMATSAVSTTGLVTVDTPAAYGFWGELWLLVGFQVGGLGYMTLGSFVILASRGSLSRARLRIGRAVFAMPEHLDPLAFIRRVVVFTAGVEVLGAIALWFAFARAGVDSPLWPAVFHAVSAFCTAGFSIFGSGLEPFRSDALVVFVVALLSVLGAVGFIVAGDVFLAVRSRRHRITLTSKIILAATVGGILLGMLALLVDPALRNLPLGDRLLAASFQSMTALTTVGFNTVPIASLSSASVLVVLVLMILGASPSGTGGGLKNTTWSAALAATWSAIKGRREITFFGSTVPAHRIQAAFATLSLYLLVFVAGSYLLLLVDGHRVEDVLFEVASGLGTVGLSRGITAELSAGGKWIIVGLMFIGRVGVVSLGLAVLARSEPAPVVRPEDDLVV